MTLDSEETTPVEAKPFLGLSLVDHFPVSEFMCHDGTPYPPAWVTTRLAKLKGVLERVRMKWSLICTHPELTVVCGYRSPPYNARLAKQSTGVAVDSQHVEGTAADVRPRKISDVPRFYAMVEKMILGGELPEVGGYGPYPMWVHIDVRDKPPSGHVAHWIGDGFGSDQ